MPSESLEKQGPQLCAGCSFHTFTRKHTHSPLECLKGAPVFTHREAMHWLYPFTLIRKLSENVSV